MLSEHPHRLHGRHKARALNKRQARAMAEVFPGLRIVLGAQDRVQPAGLFDRAPRKVWLEIGFGAGEHLIAQARDHPAIGFIGCEPFVNGIASTAAATAAYNLANIRLYGGNAMVLMERLAPATIDRVFLLYPDPWPKRRHWKRRFINTETLDQLARVMKPGADLRIATDIDANAAWILRHCRDHGDFFWTGRTAQDWLSPWPSWSGTRYECKAIAAGRRPVYLSFTRQA